MLSNWPFCPDVLVWGTPSWLVHVTVVPTVTVRLGKVDLTISASTNEVEAEMSVGVGLVSSDPPYAPQATARSLSEDSFLETKTAT